MKSHRRCVSRISDVCKWTTRNSLQEAGIQLGPDVSVDGWVGLTCMIGKGVGLTCKMCGIE